MRSSGNVTIAQRLLSASQFIQAVLRLMCLHLMLQILEQLGRHSCIQAVSRGLVCSGGRARIACSFIVSVSCYLSVRLPALAGELEQKEGAQVLSLPNESH